MVDVDKLSDAELRTKLLEFGFPVMPITGTTRKVMTKKLKMLLENKEKISKENRRSLGRYSSEEDSDTEVKQKLQPKSRRITMAAPSMPAPTSRGLRKVPKVDEISEPETPASPPPREIRTTSTTTTTRTQKIVRSGQDDFDTGSESESDIQKLSNSHDDGASPVKASLSTSYLSNRYSPPKSLDSSYSPSRSVSFNTASPGRYASFNAPSASEYAADRLNQIRSRLSLGSPSSFDKPTYLSSPIEKKDAEETPFLSNFTKKLSTISRKNDEVKEHDANGASTYSGARSYLGSYRSARGRDTIYEYKGPQSGILKNNFVSFAVLAGAGLFFLLVAVVYLGMRSDTSAVQSGYNVPYCDKSDPGGRRGNCVVENDVESALNLLAVVKPELHKRAVANRCFDAAIKPQMTESEIVAFCLTNFAIKDEKRIRSDLRSLEILSFANPDWAINVAQREDNNGMAMASDAVDSMEQLISNYETKVTSLVTFDPPVPMLCTISNAFSSILYRILMFATILSIVYSLHLVYKFYKKHADKERQEISSLVERIIDVLQSNVENDPNENFVVINHVRDMLLPLADRRSKTGAWSKAVKYINENESRVRTEVQTVAGEPYEVWRWIGSANLSRSGSPRNKSWQGQAFETDVGSVNSLPCSPTPCLKIRGMVEEGDRDTTAAKDAVLGKCARQCRILHCAVDPASGCVYLKCGDTAEAAIAYKNLHGWWYAGHLVTVKYLRLERYMQRFPDSPTRGPPYLQAPAALD